MEDARLGLVKTTLVDFPGEVAATVFTHGCNLRCPYCHNPELVGGPVPDTLLPMGEILEFLNRRRNVLGGVCITGGEPLLHTWLPEFAAAIHGLGLKVKLDTNGLLPDRIPGVNADYIAMDIKTSPGSYHLVSGHADTVAGSNEAVSSLVRKSILIVRETAPTYEFRTTVVPGIVAEAGIREIVTLLQPGERYTLAAFRPGHTLDPALRDASPPLIEELERLAEIAREARLDVRIRRQGV